MKQVWEFLKNAFRKNFIAGTLVLVPIFAAVWVLKIIVVWADNFLISMLPARFQPQALYVKTIPGLGILVTVILILAAGVFTRMYLGRKLVKLGDAIISRIPIGRSVYTIMKELLSGVLTRDKEKFKGVALVEWPRKGCYMMGFITGYREPVIEGDQTQRWVNLFVPTTPNPTTGFYIMLAEKEVKTLDISVDKAFKILITAGMIAPGKEGQKLS